MTITHWLQSLRNRQPRKSRIRRRALKKSRQITAEVLEDRTLLTIDTDVIDFSAGKDAEFDGQVASFTDTESPFDPSQYSSNILWGDGATSEGIVSLDPLTGSYSVSARHTYTVEGDFPVTVEVQKLGGTFSVDSDIVSVWSGQPRLATQDVDTGYIPVLTFEYFAEQPEVTETYSYVPNTVLGAEDYVDGDGDVLTYVYFQETAIRGWVYAC